MGYWGWRSLLFASVISVWITGCRTVQQAAPIASPTELPSITLRVHTPAGSTTKSAPGLPSATTFSPIQSPERPPAGFTPTAALRDSLLTPTPSPVNLPSPTCYQTADGGIFCLGRVDNARSYSVGRVLLLVYVYGRDGVILRSGEVVVEQRFILPGKSAPYRVIFPAETDYLLSQRFGGVSVHLLRADPVTGRPMRLVNLQAQSQRVERDDGRYGVRLEIYNVGPEDASDVRAMVTLYDAAGRVTGYRMVEIAVIASGESISMNVPVVAATPNDDLHHTLHVEMGR